MPRRLSLTAGATVVMALLCTLLGTGCGAPDLRIRDEAGLLTARQLRSIEDYLAWVASERGVDYRVVVLDQADLDLNRESVSRYERWEIGADTEGQGLLLLVNVAAGEARVEVGYGLEHRVRDVEASSMIAQFLAPYFAAGDAAMGIEASVERLVDVLEPSRGEAVAGDQVPGTGGAGAAADLLAGIDRLTPETEARLKRILVPQPRPEDCVHLEMALMARGIYYQQASMYDEAWRRSKRPSMPARRLKEIAREWSGPFQVARRGDYAIAYFEGEKARRFGPHFLRRTAEGWIVDASVAAEKVVYDYSNQAWYAVEGAYPYLELVKSAYRMQPGTLGSGRAAWAVVDFGG